MLEGADLIVQRASARGTAMASSPSRKRPDGGTRTGTGLPYVSSAKPSTAKFLGVLGGCAMQVKAREVERMASIFGSLGVH